MAEDQAVLAHTPAQAAKLANIGRTRLYDAINSGQLVARKFGGRTLILDTDLRKFLDNLPPVRHRVA